MRAREFLLEYNRQVTAQNFGARLFDVFNREGPGWHRRLGINLSYDPAVDPEFVKQQTIDFILEKLESADPTPHKEYVQWLARIYSRGGIHLEDVITQVAEDLEYFARMKLHRMIPPPYNDINRYRDFHDFAETVEKFEQQHVEKLKKLSGDSTTDRGKSREIYRDQQIRIIQPEDKAAACYYGRGTKWCTAARVSNNHFEAYNSDGPLYIIIPQTPAHQGEKYQFHFASGQFMDEKDQPIRVSNLTAKYPQLSRIFEKPAKENAALEFFYSTEDLNRIYSTLLPKVQSLVAKDLAVEKPRLVKNIIDDVVASIDGLRHFKEDLVDIVAEDVDESDEAFYIAVSKELYQGSNLLTNADIFFDSLVGNETLSEYRSYSALGNYVQELVDDELIGDNQSKKIQDYYEFEVDQNLIGNLEQFYSKSYRENWKIVTKEYLKL